MLIKLTAEQISVYWNDVKNAMLAAVPPIAYESKDKMHLVLEGLLTDNMHCWVSVRKEDEGNIIDAILVTSINFDPYSNTRSLLIYSMTATRLTRAASWISGIETLRKFAKKKKCNRVIAYSDNPQIVKICAKLGGDTSYSFISFDS